MSGMVPFWEGSRFKIDGQKSDVTGFAMRLVAVILPDLGTGPDTPIVVSYWFAARGETVWEGDRLVEVLVGPVDLRCSRAGDRTPCRDSRCGRTTRFFPGAMLGYIAALDENERRRDPRTDLDSGGSDHDPRPRGPDRPSVSSSPET